MPALWGPFTTVIGAYFDSPIPKTEQNTAKVIAKSYALAIRTCTLSMIPGSIILSTPSTSGLETAIEFALTNTKSTGKFPDVVSFRQWASELIKFWEGVIWSPLPPPIGYVAPIGGAINPRDVSAAAFNDIPTPARAGSKCTPKTNTPFTISNTGISASNSGGMINFGVNVEFVGLEIPLSILLWSAFNNPPLSSPMGNLVSTKLVNSFKLHLSAISGFYSGFLQGSPPTPGPPFIWVGVV